MKESWFLRSGIFVLGQIKLQDSKVSRLPIGSFSSLANCCSESKDRPCKFRRISICESWRIGNPMVLFVFILFIKLVFINLLWYVSENWETSDRTNGKNYSCYSCECNWYWHSNNDHCIVFLNFNSCQFGNEAAD